ncbi:hypothetical protein [Chryseobacterium sp. JAH]|nr:hypothetical protein [Chryseobacterium sp. JAH]
MKSPTTCGKQNASAGSLPQTCFKPNAVCIDTKQNPQRKLFGGYLLI